MDSIDKVLAVAKAEVGYLEKKSNSQLDSKTSNAGANNYTKYWRDIAPSLQGNYWCQAFINWIFFKAYGTSSARKLLCCNSWSFYTPTCADYFKSKNQWFTSAPQVGDIIYFKNSKRICHVGIVTAVDSKYVYTIEGNTSSDPGVVANGGSVNDKKYLLSYSNIAGYGRPNYDKEIEVIVGKRYTVIQEMYLRTSTKFGLKENKIKYSELNDKTKEKCIKDEKGLAKIKVGSSFTVASRKVIDGTVWIKTKANYWLPVITNGEARIK